MRTAEKYRDWERCAIMERIADYCRTSVSPSAHATGRTQAYVTVWAYPFTEDRARAEFAWATADHITRTSRVFNVR